MSTDVEPQQATAWKSNWLSLSGAIMWVVTRDLALTRLAESTADNDQSIEAGICVHLAQEEAEGQAIKSHMKLEEAWPAIRRLIADEKIVAEGRSLERRGMSTAVETRYPNDPIPSGDVANLIISSIVPGIKPKDALAPDEIYRFMNGQGRYWYDVRLRAADVFREFPDEPNAHDPLGSREDTEFSGDGPSSVPTLSEMAEEATKGPVNKQQLARNIDRDIFPDGPPPGLPASARRRRISDELKARDLPAISDRTYQRAGIGKTDPR